MKLEARLEAALSFIRADVHVDIGSDHARLPIELVRRDRVKRCVIVEKNETPFALARRHVVKTRLEDRVDVRLGDGFDPVSVGEVESASMTGLGVRTMLGVLDRGGPRVPPRLVVQPNDDSGLLRQWARANGYHVADEALAEGFWRYPIVSLTRGGGEDPAYDGLPLDLAVKWGPHLLRKRDPALRAVLLSDLRRLEPARRFARPEVLRDLDLVERALAFTSAEA
ncbi:tRNA (adenine(22)-N(1))-methyltransferase TrmK [Deinococcus yavapaiensis]|uniref:tRNA (Adenine22-N1)-methyltransferase n=1 Tax=Deinococcus yavapaiensis KR-236 TaxID=694435 RepID=A0A318S2M8_9DEIO|nr:tRNA (adenine(22)-N(1))-methyltransferase TrmK [Deinococcus yavapaiensis]PYE52791.1 tRNA (adenine22-N1)-methyltransferase [Deinococcus yavapaiensis KR-236]